ncbi:MAG: tetratricopeptide repeat protein [Fibrella sp.]|nr:tetratricopeptide repeat protein [Armatimonadota bacterium]
MEFLPVIILLGVLGMVLIDFHVRRTKAFAQNPGHAEAKNRLARVKSAKVAITDAVARYNRGEKEKAIRILEAWYASEPDIPDRDHLLIGYNLLGIYYAAANRLEEAAPLLTRALTFYELPDNSLPSAANSAGDAHYQLARYCLTRGDVQAKQDHYRRAAEWYNQAGQRGYAARAYADWHQGNGDHLLAAERFDEALNYPPDNADAGYRPILLVKHALSLWQAGHFSASLAAARQIVSENAMETVGSSGYRVCALAWGRLGLFAEAEGFLIEAGKRDVTIADRGQTLGTRCVILHHQGRLREIVARCEAHRNDAVTAAELFGAQVLTHYANALSATGRFDESERAYRLAIEQAPITDKMTESTTLALLRCGLANVQLERGDYEDAVSLLRDAEEEAKRVHILRFYIPALRLLAETVGESITSDVTKTRAAGHLTPIAQAMNAFPNPTDAKRYYADVLSYLARALLAAGDSGGALQILEQFSTGDALTPGMLPHWHYWRGRCHEANNEPGAARQEYLAAVESGDPESRYVAGSRERLSGLGIDA